MANMEETMMFKVGAEEPNEAALIIKEVCKSMREKGYNPINQLVGYLLSGDPAYVTSYNNARGMIRKLERDELLEELIQAYIKEEK
ncbi:MAG: hypothetical protein H6Q70_4092 [Firmicutes bacterium]|jgi:uncharacterized protein (UPF0297 family)|nr:hypothetical protein [Bacillota bacterium]